MKKDDVLDEEPWSISYTNSALNSQGSPEGVHHDNRPTAFTVNTWKIFGSGGVPLKLDGLLKGVWC